MNSIIPPHTAGLQNFLRLALTVFLFLCTFIVASGLLGLNLNYDGKRFLEISLLFAALSAVPLIASPIKLSLFPLAAASLLMMTGLASSSGSPQPDLALLDPLMLAAILASAIIFSNIVLQYSQPIHWHILASAALTLLALNALFLHSVSLYFGNPGVINDLFPGFSNSRFTNQVQTILLPLCTLTPLLISKKWRMAAFLASAIAWSAVFISDGRGILVSQLLAWMIVIIINKKHRGDILKIFLLSVLAGFFIYWLFISAIPDYIGVTLARPDALARFEDVDSPRLELWRIAIESIKAEPWLGLGPMGYITTQALSAHPHNSLLQIAAEWGIPATIFFILLSGYFFYRFTLQTYHSQDLSNTAILAGTLAAGAHSIVSGIIVTPASQICLIFILSLAISRLPEKKNQLQIPKKSATLISAGLMATLCTLVITTKDMHPITSPASHKNSFTPRFWLDSKRSSTDSPFVHSIKQ